MIESFTATRTQRYELVSFNGDKKEITGRWHEISNAVQEMTNAWWRHWEAWHTQHGSSEKLLEFASDLKKWHETKQGEKPKLSLKPIPSELSQSLSKVLGGGWPHIIERTRGLLSQILSKNLTKKDLDGRWRQWQSILMNRQGRPNCTRSQPIPFDSRTSDIQPIEGEKNYQFKVRLSLVAKGKSLTDRCQLFVKRPNDLGGVVLSRIVSGAYKFCGSSIVWNEAKKKWFALITYQMPITPPVAGDGVATFYPSKSSAWALIHGSRVREFNDAGHVAGHIRQSLNNQKWSRNRKERFKSSNSRGHGRGRAQGWQQKLSKKWVDSVNTINHQVSSDVVKHCQQNGIGLLIYLQPDDERRATRFLTNVGKDAHREDATAWDYADMATKLAYKCQEAGIALEVRKSGKSEGGAAVAVPA